MKTSKNKKTDTASIKENTSKNNTVADLLAIMAKLRGPSGCPWDKEQTENTLKKYLMEEAYEVLEAIEMNQPDQLKEELGDLLLQIIFLCRIAEEKGQFNFWEVARTLSEKLIRRHPHVFSSSSKIAGKNKPRDAQAVVEIWKSVKENEKNRPRKTSRIDGLPLAFPALERAQRMSGKASRAGFDWPNIDGVWEKVMEELTELKKVGQETSLQRVEEELGDLFFSLVNWARFKGISAEQSLRKANRRFAKRFRYVEAGLERQGRSLEEATLEEMDQLWNEAKKGGR
jgi:tetrapyrrole methylase family protein/MazG family protein